MIQMLVLSLLLETAGIICVVPALNNRTESCPPFALDSIRFKYLKPVWKIKSWFTPKGYRLYLWAVGFWATGALLGAIYWFAKS
ncbi:hypothetical protein TRIP_C20925 [Candidatus Zixiibacteriota bacterium]|nr:hypothetical protein TRIP_C20925 [candidate division Zixibacteria bacterium]